MSLRASLAADPLALMRHSTRQWCVYLGGLEKRVFTVRRLAGEGLRPQDGHGLHTYCAASVAARGQPPVEGTPFITEVAKLLEACSPTRSVPLD